uniref:Uncharacterized protein n=1 Tax=Octopus bimaculoides TaxID=37653 RepID=A0A0L8GHU5_OCTBM
MMSEVSLTDRVIVQCLLHREKEKQNGKNKYKHSYYNSCSLPFFNSCSNPKLLDCWQHLAFFILSSPHPLCGDGFYYKPGVYHIRWGNLNRYLFILDFQVV